MLIKKIFYSFNQNEKKNIRNGSIFSRYIPRAESIVNVTDSYYSTSFYSMQSSKSSAAVKIFLPISTPANVFHLITLFEQRFGQKATVVHDKSELLPFC